MKEKISELVEQSLNKINLRKMSSDKNNIRRINFFEEELEDFFKQKEELIDELLDNGLTQYDAESIVTRMMYIEVRTTNEN